MSRHFTACLIAVVILAGAQPVFPQDRQYYLEELTWTEVRDLIKAGHTTVILPTGGVEQNGPHMALGKHNFINSYNAGEIARRLGNALVAPIVAYVPEGAVNPPSGAMRYPGSITLPTEIFVQVLVWAGRSFKVSGFTDVVLIGDNGGNQEGLRAAADQLNKEWAESRTRAHYLSDYGAAAQSPDSPFDAWLVAQGETQEAIGRHAGIKDTALCMAVEAIMMPSTRGPKCIRWDKLAPGGGYDGSGVTGDPSRASVKYGRRGLEFQIEAAVNQLRILTAGK